MIRTTYTGNRTGQSLAVLRDVRSVLAREEIPVRADPSTMGMAHWTPTDATRLQVKTR